MQYWSLKILQTVEKVQLDYVQYELTYNVKVFFVVFVKLPCVYHVSTPSPIFSLTNDMLSLILMLILQNALNTDY